MEVHDGDKCITERFQTTNQSNFEPDIEISITDPEALFYCAACNLDFESSVKLENHNRKVHGKIKVECPICRTPFRRRDHMRRHMRTVHYIDQSSTCPICKEDCKEQDSLSQHIRENHPDETQYVCTGCRYVTDNLEALVTHNRIHSLRNKHVCETCSACFKRQDHLNRHVKSLHLNHSVRCEVCQQIFKRRDHLLRHTREQHANVVKDSDGVPQSS